MFSRWTSVIVIVSWFLMSIQYTFSYEPPSPSRFITPTDTINITPEQKAKMDSLIWEMMNLKYGLQAPGWGKPKGPGGKYPFGYELNPANRPGGRSEPLDKEKMDELKKELQELKNEILGDAAPPSIYDNEGKELTGKRGQESDPNYVTAEVDFSGEFATVDLNKFKGRSQKDVTPTSEDNIKVLGITPILDDTTKTPASYGWWINQTLDRLTIKSSNSNDSSKVRVWMMVQ